MSGTHPYIARPFQLVSGRSLSTNGKVSWWDEEHDARIAAHQERVQRELAARGEQCDNPGQGKSHYHQKAGESCRAARIRRMLELLPAVKRMVEAGLYRYQICRELHIHHNVLARCLRAIEEGS